MTTVHSACKSSMSGPQTDSNLRGILTSSPEGAPKPPALSLATPVLMAATN